MTGWIIVYAQFDLVRQTRAALPPLAEQPLVAPVCDEARADSPPCAHSPIWRIFSGKASAQARRRARSRAEPGSNSRPLRPGSTSSASAAERLAITGSAVGERLDQRPRQRFVATGSAAPGRRPRAMRSCTSAGRRGRAGGCADARRGAPPTRAPAPIQVERLETEMPTPLLGVPAAPTNRPPLRGRSCRPSSAGACGTRSSASCGARFGAGCCGSRLVPATVTADASPARAAARAVCGSLSRSCSLSWCSCSRAPRPRRRPEA